MWRRDPCSSPKGQGSVRPADLPSPSDVELTKVADFPGYTEGIAFVGRVPPTCRPDAIHSSVTRFYKIAPGRQPKPWLDLRIPNGDRVLGNGNARDRCRRAQSCTSHVGCASVTRVSECLLCSRPSIKPVLRGRLYRQRAHVLRKATRFHIAACAGRRLARSSSARTASASASPRKGFSSTGTW
jgi:hypothetical protein